MKVFMKLSKEVNAEIKRCFYTRDVKTLLTYFKKYPPNMLKGNISRLIIINTQDFELALEIFDSKTELDLKKGLLKLEQMKDNNYDEEDLLKKYNASYFKRDILKDELYLKFKHLFHSKLKIYKAYYFQYLFQNKINKKRKEEFKPQRIDEIKFNLTLFDDLNLLAKLMLFDIVKSKNLFFGPSKISIKNDKRIYEKTVDDLQIEAIIFKKLLKINKDDFEKIYENNKTESQKYIGDEEYNYRYRLIKSRLK